MRLLITLMVIGLLYGSGILVGAWVGYELRSYWWAATVAVAIPFVVQFVFQMGKDSK